MVRTPGTEPSTEHGTIHRVPRQLGCGTESVRLWVRQADIDGGHAPGVSTSEAAGLPELEQEVQVNRPGFSGDSFLPVCPR